MFDSLLAYTALQMQEHLAVAALCSLAWGLACVLLSPCHLAAIPVMAAHAAGYTSNTQADAATARITTVTSLGFALGYFLAITALGIGCALLGRVVDVVDELFWMIPGGLLLLWFGISLWRQHDCSGTGRLLEGIGRRLGLGAVGGSVTLGLGYGLLSSGCTLAFLAPVLLLSVPHGLVPSMVMGTAFGAGHCLPMALVGLAAPLTRRVLHSCRLKGLVIPHHLHSAVAHTTAGQAHEHDAHDEQRGEHEVGREVGHEGEPGDKHHRLERGFRKVVAVAVCLGGLTLLLHVFLE